MDEYHHSKSDAVGGDEMQAAKRARARSKRSS